MHILMFGAGGVGGYYGARLVEAGYAVSFVARGRHAAAMTTHGLQVRSQRGDITVDRPNVVDDPAKLGTPPDVAFVCVKLMQTEEAARQLAPLATAGTAVCSLQNGVDRDEVLARHCGSAALLDGTTQIGAAIAEPGVIQHTGTMANLSYGEPQGHDSARLQALDAVLQDTAARTGGFEARQSPDIRLDIWRKFSFLAPFASLTARHRSPIGPLREASKTRAELESLIAETVAVGRAAGAALPDGREAEVMKFIDGLPAEMKSSMLHDLEAGKPLELDWLTGAVLRLGQRHGVATPANQVIYDHMESYRNG
ncbi:2-dehydropantoate 2-reductase [Rhodovibrio salinarum]|uniref:2-dehydropantoate 2-reductase n=1 Tax=Rhodovibrio salinarum TaxID=1087 RepID=A0A934QM98_9PROT|nr:2-dehydropantoate 2-reductase [Rhodovibrio salinarum]MBK1698964.1 2-dehydropantoate 2-reductase [Rhodovibrio salinarum]